VFLFPWDQASEVLGWDADVRARLQSSIHMTTLGTVKKYENFDPFKVCSIYYFLIVSNIMCRIFYSGHCDSTLRQLFNAPLSIPILPHPTRGLRACYQSRIFSGSRDGVFRGFGA
jgi:hypothetical protein